MRAALPASSLPVPWCFTDTLFLPDSTPITTTHTSPAHAHSVPCLPPAHSHTPGPLAFHGDVQFKGRDDY